MAIEANIGHDDEFFLGEDKSLVFTIYQSDGTTVQDITGWSLSWMLKKRIADLDAAALITKTTLNGIVLTSAALGICTVTVNDTDTDTLEDDLYAHELKRTDDGSETVLSFGGVRLKRGVHRS